VLGAHTVVLDRQGNQLLNATNGKIDLALLGDTVVVLGNVHDGTVLVELAKLLDRQVLFKLEVLLRSIECSTNGHRTLYKRNNSDNLIGKEKNKNNNETRCTNNIQE